LLAHFGKEGVPETVIPKMSQAMLAEMIGTTRSRVSFFMNRFRKLGFIDYHAGDELQVHSSLLNIVHSLTHERSQDRDLSTEATRSGDLDNTVKSVSTNPEEGSTFSKRLDMEIWH
jgi:hypothetical protein